MFSKTKPRVFTFFLVVLCVSASLRFNAVQAAPLEVSGVLGNSGEFGSSLMAAHYEVVPFHGYRAFAGIHAAEDFTFWVSGGNAIQHVSLDGKLLERHALPEGVEIRSSSFTALNGTLYFLASVPQPGNTRRTELFALAMKAGSIPAALEVALPQNYPWYREMALSAQTSNGRLLLAIGELDGAEIPANMKIGVHALSPNDGKIEKLFSLAGREVHGLAFDAASGALTLGARAFQDNIETPDSHNVLRRDLSGKILAGEDGKARTSFFLGHVPTYYPGRISLAGGAMWDMGAIHGFIGRRDTKGTAAPGLVWRWSHALDIPIQMTDVPDSDMMAISADAPDAFHLVKWNETAGALEVVRRLGSLPKIVSLGISPGGKVTVGTARTQLWWRPGDEASTPPLKIDTFVAASPPIWNGEEFLALSWNTEAPNSQTVDAPAAFVFPATSGDMNQARAVGDWKRFDFKTPVGAAFLAAPNTSSGVLLVTDAETKTLRALPYDRAQQRPDVTSRVVPIEGAILSAPTDVAALRDGRVLLADAGEIFLLEPTGAPFEAVGYKVIWSWNGGEIPFGDSIRLAVDGDQMLVSDTRRHRVLLCDFSNRKILAQVGETDKSGNGAAQFNTPTLVALRDGRGVVADSVNQRVLTLQIR